MKIVVLGCGFHGRGIAYEIAADPGVSELVVADRSAERAERVGEKTGAAWHATDVRDREALATLLDGAALVFNAVGPYHRTGLGVVEAALAAGVAYADMCDDHEMAEALFLDPAWTKRLAEAGVPVLIGCGIAPGISALLARLACERLEDARRVSVRFSWNYSIAYPAALWHFFRINSGLAPQYIDGRYVRPGAFAGRETAHFLEPVSDRPVWYTGIIDPVSLSATLPGLETVTAKGSYLQPEANDLLRDMVRWGMTGYEPVGGVKDSPFQFLMDYLRAPEGRAVFDIPPLALPMAVRVDVDGTLDGAPRRLTYEAHDQGRKGTTAPAARAALMLARGELDFRGVAAPEGCIDPAPFLAALQDLPDITLFERPDGGAGQPLAL